MCFAGSSPKACEEAATKVCVDILVAYRKHCVTNTRAGQLILPEPLQLLPIFTLGLTKCPALRCAHALHNAGTLQGTQGGACSLVDGG